MADLILESYGINNDPGQLSSSLRREAELLDSPCRRGGSFTQHARKGETPMMRRPEKAGVLDRGMRRFVWWCLGCPIRSRT